jgi:hypothetical protein
MATVVIGCVTSKASDFAFTRIAHFNANEIDTFPGNAGINNNGEVIFGVHLPSGEEVIYVGDGSSLTPLIDTSGSIDSFFYHSRLNDSGQFAYRAIMDDGSQSLFRHSSSGEELIRITTNGIISFLPSINNNGKVSYTFREDSGLENKVYRWNGSNELLFEATGEYSYFNSITSIDDNGKVAVNAILSGGGDNLLLVDSGTKEVILDGTDIFASSATPALSYNGNIVFLASLTSGNGYAIGRYLENQEELIFGDDPTHLHVSNFPGINDSGDVAFMGAIDNVTQAFVYDETLNTVLSVGDELDGRIVAGLGLQGDGCINNYGHLALTIKFDDGSWGVYRVIPEPCSVLLLAAGGLILRKNASCRKRFTRARLKWR